jgi:hypothetical protein
MHLHAGARRFLLALSFGLVAHAVAAPLPTSPAAKSAEAYMSARDKGDYAHMAEMLSEGSLDGAWSREKVQRVDASRLRVSGDVRSRRYVTEKPGQGGAVTVIYETEFSKAGRTEERVLVLSQGGKPVVNGHSAVHCNTGACFKD